ncbi:hypothetical protein ACWDA7_19470 [Streptomyces sp. NPDC001156]
MTNEEQDTRSSGGVPNAFGNALAWKWTRQMPTSVRRTGLPTLLYALRAMANPAGELRFADRKPIRIPDIAKAACADEKDARRYMDAAIRAGVVGVRGERRRGAPTLYVLLVSPRPDWEAADAHLKKTARKPGKRPAAWQTDDESSGDRDPNQFGGPRPELTDGTDDEVRGTATRWSSGDRAPIGSGDRAPNNPGKAKELPQEMAGAVFQPQVVGAHGDQTEPHDDHPWTRCTECGRPIVPDPRRPDRTIHAACQRRLERHSA